MAWVLYQDPVTLIFALLVGGLIVFQHRGNIQRLLNGNENKFSLHKSK
jgi:glycerol-3-phosphate acyltransferase PlsY